MERNRDLRRATVAGINGMPRRRHKITEEDGQKKNKNREIPKRRRVEGDGVHPRSAGGDADGMDDSYEEDYEEEENGRIRRLNQMDRQGLTSSSVLNNQSNRRTLRSLRSSPALRTASDAIIGVPIPRRTRSASAKRLHEYCNSGSGGSGEDQSRRRLSPSTASVKGGDIVVPSSSGVSLMLKKSPGPETWDLKNPSNSRKSLMIQDDIEIEVAEALFDLMKQSQSQSSRKQENPESDNKNTTASRCIDSPILTKYSQTSTLSRDLNSSLTPLLDDAKSLLFSGLENLMRSTGSKGERDEDDNTMGVDTVDPAEQKIETFLSNTAQESVNNGVVNKAEMVVHKESVSPPCAKVNGDGPMDSTGTKAKTNRMKDEMAPEIKFTIDLMAPPPMPSSPERDGFTCMRLDPKCTTQNVQMKSETVEQDYQSAVAIQPEERKMERNGVLQELQDLDIKKPDPAISSSSGPSKPPQQQWKELTNQLQSSSFPLPFPIATSGWPSVIPQSGIMPSLQTVIPINGSVRSSTAFPLPPFKLSNPRPMRCATHQYIAQNIRYRQQLTEKALCTGAAASTLCSAKSLNLNSMQPSQKHQLGNPSKADVPSQSLTTSLGTDRKDKSLEAAVSLDNTEGRRHVLQQAPQQVPAGNLVGPAFLFPLSQHQAAVAATANHSGPPQHAAFIANASISSGLATRPPVLKFNHSKFPSNETPPCSSNDTEMLPKGGIQAPSMPFLNCYISSPFNVSQNLPQLSHPHVLDQSAPQDGNTSSDASSHKSPYSNQQTGMKMGGNSFFMPILYPELPEKQQLLPTQSSSQSDTEISRKTSVVTGSLVSHSMNTNKGLNFLIPIPSMNFPLIPGKMSSGEMGSKYGDSQKQGSNSVVDIIPPSFSMSFGSNASTTPAIKFLSMAQNSTVLLPDVARYGYQMAPAAQMGQQHKNSQNPEGRTRPGTNNTDDGQKVILGSPPTTGSGIQSLTGTPGFDGSAQMVNFLPAPVAANQSFPSSSAAMTSFVSMNMLNIQQHHQPMVHHQKQHVQQMQLMGTAHFKEPKFVPGSFVTSSFPNNSLVSSQISVLPSNSSLSTQWQNLPRTAGVSSAPATSSLVNIPQQQPRNSQGPTQISFGTGVASAVSNAAAAPLVAGSPSNSSMPRNMESSANGPSQKPSPACGRNVPPILSTCPSQLSELKY